MTSKFWEFSIELPAEDNKGSEVQFLTSNFRLEHFTNRPTGDAHLPSSARYLCVGRRGVRLLAICSQVVGRNADRRPTFRRFYIDCQDDPEIAPLWLQAVLGSVGWDRVIWSDPNEHKETLRVSSSRKTLVVLPNIEQIPLRPAIDFSLAVGDGEWVEWIFSTDESFAPSGFLSTTWRPPDQEIASSKSPKSQTHNHSLARNSVKAVLTAFDDGDFTYFDSRLPRLLDFVDAGIDLEGTIIVSAFAAVLISRLRSVQSVGQSFDNVLYRVLMCYSHGDHQSPWRTTMKLLRQQNQTLRVGILQAFVGVWVEVRGRLLDLNILNEAEVHREMEALRAELFQLIH
jgi:hypothetical protein